MKLDLIWRINIILDQWWHSTHTLRSNNRTGWARLPFRWRVGALPQPRGNWRDGLQLRSRWDQQWVTITQYRWQGHRDYRRSHRLLAPHWPWYQLKCQCNWYHCQSCPCPLYSLSNLYYTDDLRKLTIKPISNFRLSLTLFSVFIQNNHSSLSYIDLSHFLFLKTETYNLRALAKTTYYKFFCLFLLFLGYVLKNDYKIQISAKYGTIRFAHFLNYFCYYINFSMAFKTFLILHIFTYLLLPFTFKTNRDPINYMN